MIDAGRFFANNTGNSITLLNAAVRHGVPYFVFSSTGAVYADGAPLPLQETAATEPANAYGETKLLVERMLPWYERVHGLRSAALRYFNAAGGALDGSLGQDHLPATHIITRAILQALGKEQFVLFGDDYPTADGTCVRDYIHVLDLASAHVLALEHLAAGGASDVFNCGTGRGYSNWQVVDAVKRISGVDFPVAIGPRRPGDAAELVADSTRLRRVLGWEPLHSDIDTIVASAWEWHRTHPDGYAREPAAVT
jgi:UDP-glucose 4-epimerase